MSQIEELLKRRHQVLGRNSPLFYDKPLNLVRGEGVWVYDADGCAYLDVYNNVPCVGHCHPHVVEAVARQSAKLNLHTRYLDENLGALDVELTGEDRAAIDAAFPRDVAAGGRYASTATMALETPART